MPPLYEFTCTNKKCNHKSEKLVKTDTKHITCSKCGSESIKIISLPSDPRFTGGGWTPKFHPKMDR